MSERPIVYLTTVRGRNCWGRPTVRRVWVAELFTQFWIGRGRTRRAAIADLHPKELDCR